MFFYSGDDIKKPLVYSGYDVKQNQKHLYSFRIRRKIKNILFGNAGLVVKLGFDGKEAATTTHNHHYHHCSRITV
jgi:hypothetical protein